jgi:predicted RNase H-like HicB family nuclease
MTKKKYTVVVEKDDDGWLIADVPELQGCHTQAKTMNTLIKRVKEVIELCEEDKETKTQFVGIQLIEA